MKFEYVNLVLSNYPEFAEQFIKSCSVISKNKPDEAPRIHKKGSTIALFENALKYKSYEFVLKLALGLKDETKTHKEGSLEQRKAGDLLINIYRWSAIEPYKDNLRIQEIRMQVFPESEISYYDTQLANYIKRRTEKAQRL